MLSFKTTKQDQELIHKIAERAEAAGRRLRICCFKTASGNGRHGVPRKRLPYRPCPTVRIG